jgi:hypothetical protein
MYSLKLNFSKKAKKKSKSLFTLVVSLPSAFYYLLDFVNRRIYPKKEEIQRRVCDVFNLIEKEISLISSLIHMQTIVENKKEIVKLLIEKDSLRFKKKR